MGGFTCDVLAAKIFKLFESEFQNLSVLLQVIRYIGYVQGGGFMFMRYVFIKNIHSLVDN
jgi:hypothetical protein